MVPPVLLVVLPVPAHFHPRFVQERPTVGPQSGLLLGDGEQEAVEQQKGGADTNHLHLISATVREGLPGQLGQLGHQQQPLAGGLPTTTLSHGEGHPGSVY